MGRWCVPSSPLLPPSLVTVMQGMLTLDTFVGRVQSDGKGPGADAEIRAQVLPDAHATAGCEFAYPDAEIESADG